VSLAPAPSARLVAMDAEEREGPAPARSRWGWAELLRIRRGRLMPVVLLAIGAVAMLVPFGDMILGALRSPAERLARPPVYFPAVPQWQNFRLVFETLPLGLWLFNSVVVTVAITACQLLTSTMAAYALAKFEFRGRDWILRFVLGAQLFPFFLLIIPTFFMLRYVPLFGGNGWTGTGGTGLLNTYAALVLPFVLSWYGIFMMRQFIVGVPTDIIEAARMDGAGEWAIFWRIVVPVVRPALTILGVFVFIYHWNEVIWTLTVTRSAPDLQTAPIGTYLLRSAFEDQRNLSLQQAAIVVTILPVVVLFLLTQRFYLQSAATGRARGEAPHPPKAGT